MGVGRLRRRVRVQYASVRSEEAVRHGRGPGGRLRRLHNRRDPARRQSAAAEAVGRRPEIRAADGRRDHKRDGRREGRHRRRNHRDAFMNETRPFVVPTNRTTLLYTRAVYKIIYIILL